MRKLIRIAVVVVTLAAIALVAPGPASADHAVIPDLPDDPHEVIPLPAVVSPVVPCVVTGELFPGAAAQSKNHLIPPAGNAASHSHYSFIQTEISCLEEGDDWLTALPVEADGGNDGHLVDLDGDCVPPTGSPGCIPGPSGFHHPHGPAGGHENHGNYDQAAHHGSTNESGWSHSSGYSGPGEAVDHAANAGHHYDTSKSSNDCDNPDANLNKGDIVVDPDGGSNRSDGWVKYIRVGTVIAVWGCFYSGPLAVANPLFSSQLTLFPPAVFNNPHPTLGLPDCLLPPVDNPTYEPPLGPPGVGPNPIIAEQDGCGFSIAGVAERGSSWACDYAHPPSLDPCSNL